MKTIQSTVAFQDPQGNAVANGTLVLQLSQAAEITSGGGQVVPLEVRITLDATGKIPANTSIWANDQLTPSGTTYTAYLKDSSNAQVASFGPWSIQGSSPIDLSQEIATSTGASFPSPVLLSPAGDQTITAGNLSLPKLEKIRFADQFAGSDLGAKINAASSDAGANGVIYVNAAGTISTALSLAASTVVYFAPGVYEVATGHTISANGVKLRGAGTAATIFEITSATGDWFTITGANFECSGMQMRPATAVTRTAGSFFNIQSTEVLLRDLKIIDPFNFVSALSSSAGKIELQLIRGDSSGGNWNYFIKTLASSGTMADTHLTGCYVNVNAAATQTDALVVLDSGTDTVSVTNCDFICKTSSNPAIRCIDSLSRTLFPRWVHFVNTFCESNSNTCIDLQSVRDFKYVDSYIATCQKAVNITASAAEVVFADNVIANVDQSAFVTASGSIHFSILGNTFEDIGISANNTYPIIDLSAGACTNFRIMGNGSKQINANQPNFGVKFAAAAYGNFALCNNTFTGTAGGSAISGAASITGNNWYSVNNPSDPDNISSTGINLISVTAGNDYVVGLSGLPSGKAYKFSLGNRDVRFDSGGGTGVVRVSNSGTDVFTIASSTGITTEATANGANWVHGNNSELLTLSTSGTTTDTSANLLPANSIIEAVVVRITTTITTATNWEVGDATQAARFISPNSTLTAGTTAVGLNQADPTVASSNLGPVQTSAAKVRVTTTGTPGAGAIRITVFYRQFVAPTS